MRLLPAILALIISASAVAAQELSNGYFSLRARNGWFDSMRFDPSGKGRYGENLITALYVGEKPHDAVRPKVETAPNKLVFRDLVVRNPFATGKVRTTFPVRMTPGSTLGARFTVKSGRISRVSANFPTWHRSDCGCTLSIYRVEGDGIGDRKLIATRKFENIRDNAELSLELDPQPAGVFYLEASEPVGESIGWWGAQADVDPSMTAWIGGEERADMDLSVSYSGYEEITGDWTVTLDGSNLKTDFRCSADAVSAMKTVIVTPWEKAGYDLSKFPFSRFYSDTGRHVIPQQWKRRPSNHIQHGVWVYAMGKKDYDLRINLPGQRLTWEFTDDEAMWKVTGTTLSLDVLPHTDKLPDYYPVFYSSDSKTTQTATEFYYSHGLNFGVGTPPDWKEWQALILDWIDSPQTFEQRGHFTGVKMRPDGYVHTWGEQEGWPFPYKDEDKDGKNDFDTRHFTPNSCIILGAYRYFVWKRDVDFLKEMMPKLRRMMEYQLNDLHGKDGIIVIDAVGHEGRADGIGSNYWDILPFGYKDAFCNTYYYASLQAMAELEQFCIDQGLDLPGEKRTPEFYAKLRDKVRISYNRTFWDDKVGRYVGCVDIDGVKHDHGFTFVNLEAMAYGLADKWQVERIYKWMETEPTSSGKADTYSRWVFAPRALTIHNPPREANSNFEIRNPNLPPSWWHSGWGGTDYDGQCQNGGAILYTSGYDIMARAKYLGADNAYKRFTEILGRYNMPDRLMGGNPLYTGETSQGGGNGAGSVGVEGEFPESGLVPASYLYAFLGIEADITGLKIRPNLPSTVKYAGVRNLCYAGTRYDIRVTNDSVEITQLNVVNPVTIKRKLKPGETFVLTPGVVTQ